MSLLFGKLCARLKEVSEYYYGVMGIAIKDLMNGESFMINGDEFFPVASTIKVPILIEFFKQVEEGKLNPTQTLRYEETQRVGGSGIMKALSAGVVTMPVIDYATLMINVSDNSTTNYLIDLLGMDNINFTISELGLKVTRLARKMMDIESLKAGKDSFTTPRELVILFEELHKSAKLSPFVCEETLKMLKKPKEGIIQGVIRNAVPDLVEVADKSGWVDGATLDAGIVYQWGRPYIIALLAKHIPTPDLHMFETLSTLTEVARLINSYFVEVSTSTPQGRRVA